MAAAIDDGKGANGDGEGFERCRGTMGSGLAGEHAGDVVLERDGADVIAPA
jgi:hypothetical protein